MRKMWPYGRGGGSRPPTPIGNIFAWYDFSDASTITLDGSGKISQILDRTGNPHNATQATPSQRPGQTTVNGLSAGLFVSANHTLLSSGPGWPVTVAEPFSVCLVWTQTVAGSASYQPGVIGGIASPPPPILFQDSSNDLFMLVGTTGIAANNPPLHAPYTQQLATLFFNETTSNLVQNNAGNPGTVDNTTLTNISLGTAHNPTDPSILQHMDGAICEVLYFIGQLTVAQRRGTEVYLQTKWGTP